ncbi:MAG TPA: hypothetical protein VK525_15495 [Candidatus Saccharimonadales bacterium]|jgi:hypothetical protein|nr:hypothetical protein [Candidatus Saccharimonadales bacterium]
MKNNVLYRQSSQMLGKLFRFCVVLSGSLFGFLTSVLPQTPSPADGPWSGSAQCRIQVQGPGYADQQTHSWTITGASPTPQGALRLFAGSWSVAGSGALERSQGNQTLKAQWTTAGQNAAAPISVFVRASDGRVLIKLGHAQLRYKDGVSGTQQVYVNGQLASSKAMALEAFEWQLPVAEDASTATTIHGATQQEIKASVGPMQPAGSRVTASCSWQFTRPPSPPK